MTEHEKKLFKELCKFKSNTFEEALLAYATPEVLGHLFFNRMQGIAFGILKNHGLLGKVNREFRSSLGSAFEQNLHKNRSYAVCVETVSKLLAACGCPAAMLKGAYLFARYPEGYRTANDIDLLVLPQNVTAVGEALISSGFRQGNIQNGVFVPAERKDIIASRMMRGETVPYLKEVNLPYMKYLEVDINFSLDYKNSDSPTLPAMMKRVERTEENGIRIPTLQADDFFIHLCAHLYKEATTLPWIQMRRDMTLYKYGDIYLLLSEMSTEEIRKVFVRARSIGMEKICAYAVLETAELFEMTVPDAKAIAIGILEKEPDFRLKVVSPAEKKILMYRTAEASERFFLPDRKSDLKEVTSREEAAYA